MVAEASGVIVSLVSFVLIEGQEEACWTWSGGRSCGGSISGPYGEVGFSSCWRE